MGTIIRILSISFFCFVLVSLNAQTYEDLVSKGNTLYSEGQFQASADAYAQAFELKAGGALEYYNAACSAALAGDSERSIEFLKKAAGKGYANLSHIKRDSDLHTLAGSPGWEEVLEMVKKNKEESEKGMDIALKEQLEFIFVRDQTLRQLYEHAEELFGRESDEMQYFWGLVAREDSTNEAEVEAIIQERGWVGKSLVGGKANMALWLVIQHAPLETQEKYLPLMRESAMKGESSGAHLAMLEDRIRMRNEEPQIYGSQITIDPATGQNMFYEILEPEYVNQRRREVGLGPIEDYARRFGLEWTIEQKEK